jgi:hypothetical protein
MHILLSHGVANHELYFLLKALRKRKLLNKKQNAVGDYIQRWKLPHKRGKVSAAWVAQKNMKNKTKTVASFAGLMLSIVPLVNAFMQDIVEPTGVMQDECRCWALFTKMLGILSLGPHGAMQHLDKFDDAAQEHASIYVALWPHCCPPKFHTTFHITEIARRLSRCLSCFVTERKHRFTKRAAVHTFRHIETTVLKDIVNKHCCEVMHPTSSLFQREFMHKPKKSVDCDLMKSSEITSECGLMRYNDYVYLRDGEVAKVIAFWRTDDTPIAAQVETYTAIDEHRRLWSTNDPVTKFVYIDDIVDTIAWAHHEPHIIRVILPVVAIL